MQDNQTSMAGEETTQATSGEIIEEITEETAAETAGIASDTTGEPVGEQNADKIIELVTYLARSLVDSPDEVKVNRVQGENSVILELSVGASDVGKVIGKQGRIAKAIRSVVKAAASKQNISITLEIV